MYVGALTLDVLLGDVRSLKQKRSAVRPVVAEVRRRYPGVAVAETGHTGPASPGRDRGRGGVRHRRARGRGARRLRALVAARPEIELLSARQRLLTEEE